MPLSSNLWVKLVSSRYADTAFGTPSKERTTIERRHKSADIRAPTEERRRKSALICRQKGADRRAHTKHWDQGRDCVPTMTNMVVQHFLPSSSTIFLAASPCPTSIRICPVLPISVAFDQYHSLPFL